MFRPPQILRVKRKRKDGPVDSLYIETERSPNKRRATHHEFVFRRVQDIDCDHTNTTTDKPPQVVATPPGQENGLFQRQHRLLPESTSSREPTSSDTIPCASAAGHSASTSTMPRRFRLCRASAPDITEKYMGKGKRGIEQDSNVALLVEASESRSGDGGRAIDARHKSQLEGATDGQVESRPPLKRPGAGSRVEKISSYPRLQKTDPDASLCDQEHLLQYAAEEMGYDYKAQSPTTNSTPLGLAASIRSDIPDWIPRSTTLHAHDDLAKIDSAPPESFDDMDYVYDTFVRSRNADDLPPSNESTGKPVSFGVIVIEEDQQTHWQEFGDDETESDKDWNSDQDDENAENYYGADYPEDEVDSDDEQGYGVYRYRHGGASDDEEYGSDWSNAGDAYRFPWKKKPLKGGIDTEGSDAADIPMEDQMEE